MFHVDCPKFRGFATWDELGCLARACGFPTDLFKSNITKHITVEDHGISVEQVNKMLDLRLLQKSIHRTRNLHTGEWNTKVIRKALYLLDYHALTYEELYNIRIAYKAYEGNDMRGMPIDERMLLAALKMCGRSIAPLKMMHRIKHMSVNFEEPGRMQLFEFLDLVLWADLYEEFTFESMERAEGKEGDLFKLVDFDRLLSHHDKKLADKLNNAYLKEEWDFGQETLRQDKFKEPPVVCGESRMQMVREQKLKYRYLKSELIKSHGKMYKAKAGYIRERPITAPDLSMYEEDEEDEKPQEFTAQDAYQIVQRKVKSANAALGRTRPDLSDKPDIPKPQNVWRAKVVSDEELEESRKKYDVLKFDMETVKGRFDYQKEKEIEYFFPGQVERLIKQQEEKEESEAADVRSQPSQKYKPKVTQKEVHRLAYPGSHLPPSHAKACDARFRGWHNVKKKKGSHFVLVAPSFENSHTGRLHKKLVETTNAPVKKIKGDFVHRYTKKTEVNKSRMRPNTAPANLQSSDSETEIEAFVQKSLSPADSYKTADTGYGSMEDKLGEGSSAESVVKSPEVGKTDEPTRPQSGCPRPFENRQKLPKDDEVDNSAVLKRTKESKNATNAQKQLLSAGSRSKTDLCPKISETKVSENNRPKTSGHISSESSNSSACLKEGPVRTINQNNRNSRSAMNKRTSVSENKEKIDLNRKIENYKKDLSKHVEKKIGTNQRHSAKSPSNLQFTFNSVSHDSDEEELDIPLPVKSNKMISFDDDYSSPSLSSPRTPEPVVYTKQAEHLAYTKQIPKISEPTIYTKLKKEVIDIENLPVPQLQHSKPKTVAVGAIGKISLLESITESRFWEEAIEETYRKQSYDDNVFAVEEDKELVDLKEEDFEDDTSSDSGFGGTTATLKPKKKNGKKTSIPTHEIDDKIMKAKMERLKRQKRVLKESSTFQKMGIAAKRNSRSSKTSTSSDTSNKDQETSTKQSIQRQISNSSKTKDKNDKNVSQKSVVDEIMRKINSTHNATEDKQKKFCQSMKRLVTRMDGSLSTDMRSKMLATRLT